MPSLSFIYAHGNLEDRMGWDCLCGSLPQKEGVHPCVFRDEDGEASCIAFVWVDRSIPAMGDFVKMSGLVCLADDNEAMAHAMARMVRGTGC